MFATESVSYAVWNVYGYRAGNLVVLHVYHFTERANADQHAQNVGGYVMRSRLAEEPEKTV